MIVFARPVLQKTCLNCPTTFETTNPAAKYCDECRPLMKARKSKECRLRERAEYRTYTPPPVAAPVRRMPVLRARTLAETPDVPAEATRGEQLTGKAGACCTAGRVVHAHANE